MHSSSRDLVNLASRALGAGVVAANDESFGEKENLVVDAAPHFVPGTFGHKGEIVDGWETRRRRDAPAPGEPAADWAIVRLGAPGVIRSVDVDTSNFTGNYPTHAWVEACRYAGHPDPAELLAADWTPLVARMPLAGDGHNVVEVDDDRCWTHVRLWVEPDGGVARLRVLGDVVPDVALVEGLTVDLAARVLGGVVVDSSDEFYTRADAVNAPGEARTMGEGWETRRLRGEGHDFLTVRLAGQGVVSVLEVDTRYFLFNASRHVSIWGADLPAGAPLPPSDDEAWFPLLERTRLQPDTRHAFRLDGPARPVTHVRLDAFPDGGLARLRVHGTLTDAALVALRERAL